MRKSGLFLGLPRLDPCPVASITSTAPGPKSPSQLQQHLALIKIDGPFDRCSCSRAMQRRKFTKVEQANGACPQRKLWVCCHPLGEQLFHRREYFQRRAHIQFGSVVYDEHHQTRLLWIRNGGAGPFTAGNEPLDSDGAPSTTTVTASAEVFSTC